jgi:hypothetical protein
VRDVHSIGFGCVSRSIASGPSGTATAPARKRPSSRSSNDEACCARRTASMAKPGRSTSPATTSNGTRRIRPSKSAAVTNAPDPRAPAVRTGLGPTVLSARHSSGRRRDVLSRIGVTGPWLSRGPAPSTKPRTEGAARSASRSCASPSTKSASAAARRARRPGSGARSSKAAGPKRSGASSSRSRAITAGETWATALTTCASRARGQGQGPNRSRERASRSTIAMSGSPPLRDGSIGSSVSSDHSRTAARTGQDGSAQISSGTKKAALPAIQSRSPRCRIFIEGRPGRPASRHPHGLDSRGWARA